MRRLRIIAEDAAVAIMCWGVITTTLVGIGTVLLVGTPIWLCTESIASTRARLRQDRKATTGS